MSKIGVLALYTFYHLYCELCDNAQISPSRAATEIGFNRATVTTWKNTGNAPKGELLSKIAKYFDVPTDFLLGLQPFNDWENINANRKKFIDESHIDSKLLSAIWKINSDEPETASLSSFIKFVNEAIVSAEIGSDGAWAITVKENFKGMTVGAQLKLGKKKPAPEIGDGLSETERQIMNCVHQMSPKEQEAFLAWLQASQGRG